MFNELNVCKGFCSILLNRSRSKNNPRVFVGVKSYPILDICPTAEDSKRDGWYMWLVDTLLVGKGILES